MAAPKVITIDFETQAIQRRPQYPPVPVGFSIKRPSDRKSIYYAWGHPTKNNCTKAQAQRILRDVWIDPTPKLFHNAKFDVDVAETHMGVPAIDWRQVHDTLYLLFLHNPHALNLSLKPSAERLLGMPSKERDAVRDWLVEHDIVKARDGKWGAHISAAPGDVVGAYADGDVMRTIKIFNMLYPEIVRRGMLAAYNRERELMPILLENERQGVRIDLRTLLGDITLYKTHQAQADNWLRKQLKTPELNLDSDREVATALNDCNIVTDWILTPTGQRSTAKKNLKPHMFKDAKISAALGYRNRLQTCLSTFMLPWAEMAMASEGHIYTNWNQVRQNQNGSQSQGARTGRLSSNPNFQNIPQTFDDKNDGYMHPKHIRSLTELPLIRKYVLPDKGQWLMHRDYNQQEFRILAHFEDGALQQAYITDPRTDLHQYVQQALASVYGLALERRAVKVVNFGLLYGMGAAKLAMGLNKTVEEARQIKQAQLTAIPGLRSLDYAIKKKSKAGEPIRTWGGREYYVEQPTIIDGRTQTYEYKLLNYLIQGSAGDCTKQALINYHQIKKHGRFLLSVHDECNGSVPKKALKEEMALLRESMESVEFDVPMLSDPKVSGKNWSELVKIKD